MSHQSQALTLLGQWDTTYLLAKIMLACANMCVTSHICRAEGLVGGELPIVVFYYPVSDNSSFLPKESTGYRYVNTPPICFVFLLTREH